MTIEHTEQRAHSELMISVAGIALAGVQLFVWATRRRTISRRPKLRALAFAYCVALGAHLVLEVVADAQAATTAKAWQW